MQVSTCACARIGQRGSHAGLGPQRASAAVPATPLGGLQHLQQHILHTCAVPRTIRSALLKSCIHAHAAASASRASPGALTTRTVHCRGSKTDGNSSSSKSTAEDIESAETHSSSGHQSEQPSSSGASQRGNRSTAAANDTGSDDDDQVLQKLLSLLEGDSESKVDDGAGSEDEDEYLDAESDEDGSDEDESSMDTSLEAMLREKTLSAAVLDLAGSMAAVGLQGSAALVLGYLVMQRSLLDSFRWSTDTVETGLIWSLPVLVFSVLISALPLPTHKELMYKVRAAAATAGSSSSSSSTEEAWPLKGLDDARRMAQNAALVSDMPIRVEIDLGGGGDERQDKRLLTKLSPAAVTATLRYMQEFVSEPWSLKTDSVQTWAVRIVGGLLRRLSTEVWWRGFVVAGLAGWLYSTWESAGTSQDSPLFYARLFGLLTPQTSIALISLILVATRLPADLTRTQPVVTYTRLASMETEVVGRLTEDDWLVMVLPAEVAAAAAAVVRDKEQEEPTSKSKTKGSIEARMQESLLQKVQAFGRLKGAWGKGKAAAASATAAGASQQQQLSRQEMEQQLDKLLADVQEWRRKYRVSSSGDVSSSSSSSSSSQPPVGFKLTQREQEAAELAAELLELVKASAVAKAAAAVSGKSKLLGKSAGLPGTKLASGLELLLRALNDDPQRRLLLLHVPSEGPSRRPRSSSSSLFGDADAGDSNEEEDDSSDEDDDESSVGRVQAVMRAKARTAAEDARHGESTRRVESSKAVKDESFADKQGQLDETVASLRDALQNLQDKQQQQQQQQQQGAGSSGQQKAAEPFSSGDSNSSGSSSDSEEGLSPSDIGPMVMKTVQQLKSFAGRNSEMAQYLLACKGAYRVATNIPTAQDRLAYVLLLCFSLLEQLAVAGAFVASSGNLAASFTAAAALQVVTVTLQEAVGRRERQRLRQAMGTGWGLQLQLLGDGVDRD